MFNRKFSDDYETGRSIESLEDCFWENYFFYMGFTKTDQEITEEIQKTISLIWDLPKQTRRLQRKYRSVSRLERNRKNPGIMKIRYIDLLSSVCHVATTD